MHVDVVFFYTLIMVFLIVSMVMHVALMFLTYSPLLLFVTFDYVKKIYFDYRSKISVYFKKWHRRIK